jgi:4-hydroxybenzoate polyprenyltransferase
MGKTLTYLKLFRWPNLLMIALTQYLIRHAVILPALASQGIGSGVSNLHFAMLAGATVGLSAAGYAINDYFDLRIDRINKPDRQVIGKSISRREAILSHRMLNILSVAVAVFVGIKLRYWPLVLIFTVCPAILWLYSSRLKRQFLTGNFVVALLTALSVILVWMVEYHAVRYEMELHGSLRTGLTRLSLFYGAFAFLLSLVREILKDMEDAYGDGCAGCRTLPIVLGIMGAKNVVFSLMLLLVVVLFWAQLSIFAPRSLHAVIYLALLVQVPSLALLPALRKENRQQGFRRLQRLVKLVMLAGVLSMILLVEFFLQDGDKLNRNGFF